MDPPSLSRGPQSNQVQVAMSQLSPLGDATAGAIGAVFANTLVFPLDVIKTRLQVQTKALKTVKPSQHYNSAVDALLKIYQNEGLRGLYSGFGAGLFGTVVSSFSYFYIYGNVRGAYHEHIGNSEISTAMELVLGAAAGALCQFVVLPITVVTTRQQTDAELKHVSLKRIISLVFKDEGYQGFWKGLKASLVLCTNPAITYGMFERLKALLIKHRGADAGPLSTGHIFLIGALSKTLATIVTYPYIMAKVRMQWRPPKDLGHLTEKEREMIQYKSSLDILRKVYKTDGFAGWYKGMSTQILKAVLCQAILFVSKEKLTWYTLLLFSLFDKSKRGVKIAE
ncbi:mitochondrial carrier domain-containing protein [Entophlyctis helioformis]|nr:mitochondrial carrier domain-containing protein [Entophlyctis helioformis]